jgi:hypothetical protein
MKRMVRCISFGSLSVLALAAMAVPLGLRGPDLAAGDTASFPDAGVLRLASNLTSLKFSGGGGVPAGTQALTFAKTCGLSTTPTYAALTGSTSGSSPSAASVGSHDWAIGVCAKPGDADAGAGRVDASLQQVLTLKLAGSLANKEIVSAELDIEAKFQAKVEAQLYLDGALVTTVQLDATKGPFSGGGDNLRWVIGRSDANPSATDSVFYTGPVGLFDELRLRAVEGAFSLESGLDGTAPGDEGQMLNTKESLFQLTDSEGVLACGDVVTEAGSATSPSATFTRIDTDGADCNTLIPYSLTSAGGTLSRTMTLTKPTVPGAKFTIVIAWDPETAQYPLTRTTTIDYGQGAQPIQWCGGPPSAPELPSGQNWCLTNQQVQTVGGSPIKQIKVTETFFGAGDPVYSRPR